MSHTIQSSADEGQSCFEPMPVYQLHPLEDPRWAQFIEKHPDSSVFHTVGWLKALYDTYDYEPIVYTTSPPESELTNGIVLCKVRSWLTGSRAISLPFSDHCQPLLDNSDVLSVLIDHIKESAGREHWKYFELRPLLAKKLDEAQEYVVKSEEFSFHKIDLRSELDELFNNFHKSSIRQSIRRAEREGLTCEEGRSEALLTKFYRLQLLTRRRHQIPPQPLRWFWNLADCFGEDLAIRVASKGGQPIASIITLTYKKSLVYKYGCSDEKFHNLGGMPLLFWRAIQDGKRLGATEFDLGRSDLDNPGLATFKEHLGAARSDLLYFRVGQRLSSPPNPDWKMRIARATFAHLPDPLMRVAGNLLYRHVG